MIRLSLFLMLLSSALTHKRLQVQIDVDDFYVADADASGEIEQVITDDELKIFGITDEAIRKGVWKMSRSKPDAVFVKDSLNNLSYSYNKYDWDEVTADFETEKATLLNMESKSHVIGTKEIVNNNSYVYTVDVANIMPYNLSDTISTSWGKFSGINDSNTEVEYTVTFEDRKTELYFNLLWGQNILNSQPVAIKDTDERHLKTSIELGPYETVTAELVATQVIVDLMVEYEVGFDGHVVCHYAKNNVFKEYDIETVLENIGFPEKLIVRETVQFVVNTDVKLLVKQNKS